MKNSKFNTHFSFWGMDIHIRSNNQQLFDWVIDYFHNPDDSNENVIDKRIEFYFEKKKTLPRGRWDLDNWKKETYVLESWSRDITVRLNYQKGRIRSSLSSQCKFPKEAIEDLLIFRPLSLLLTKFGFFIIHAGCVVKDGSGILIPSTYGKGKTITTLLFVRKGFRFLGDEYTLLKESNGKIKAYAFPQRIGIKKNLINLFPELKFLHNRKDSPHKKKRFWIEEVYPKAAIYKCHPQLIIFPHFNKNNQLNLTKISKTIALLNILKDKENVGFNRILTSTDTTRINFNILSSLVKQIDAYHLTYSPNKIYDLGKIIEVFQKHLLKNAIH